MRLRQLLPALVTMVTLTCGLVALDAARMGDWDVALRLILLAAVTDGIDGPLARRLRATSAMGEQLDSLADLVAFGVAPAFLFSTYYGRASDPVRLGVALAFVLAGTYRLARFHAQPTAGVFCGLPITAAGPLLTTSVAGPFGASVWETGAIGLGLAVLMVCHHPFPTFAQSRRWLLPAIAAASLPVTLWPSVQTLAIVVAFILGAYVAWGVMVQVVGADLPEIGIEDVQDAG